MDKSLDLSAVFCFDRQTVAVSSHGDDRILEISPQRSVHQTGQCGVDLVIDRIHAAADPLQRRTGVIADLILREDAPFNFIGERSERLQTAEIFIQAVGRVILCLVPSVCFYTSGIGKQAADAQ